MEEKQKLSDELLKNIKKNYSSLEALLKEFLWLEEDFVYRAYHQSFKVFYVIEQIKQAKDLFEKIMPESLKLNNWFVQILEEALAKEFKGYETNANWLQEIRPILEAFWHSKYFLKQILRYGKELDESPQLLPSGWAAVLCLYNLR